MKKVVVALAGRRVDAPGAPPRFPLDRIAIVRGKIEAALRTRAARALVSAAACGADLLALEVAADLGLERWIVLPFTPERFRDTSVIDRPGDWGPRYDEAIATARASGHLSILAETLAETAAAAAAAGDDIYLRANEAILDRAQAVEGGSVLALVVWDGKPRDASDVTAAFAASARRRNIPVEEIPTT